MVYAGFWKRFAASVIDGIIVWIPSIALNFLVPYVGGILLSLLYKPIFESSSMMATPGKSIMGLTVLSESGQRLTLKQAYTRFFCSFLSGFVLMMGYLMNIFTLKKQTLHDMIAETVVVVQQPPEMNYFDVWLTGVKELFNCISGDAPTTTVYGSSSQSTTPVQTTFRQSNTVAEQTKDVAKAIEDLHKLLQSGAITQDEYDSKKQALLSKI